SSEGGVGSSSVVVLEPGVEGVGACGVRVVAAPGGPFGLQGAVEAFDFAVGPGAVRADVALLRAERGDGVAERGGAAVGERVVGEHPFDAGDAVGGEVRGGAEQERGGGGAGLVG